MQDDESNTIDDNDDDVNDDLFLWNWWSSRGGKPYN